MSLRDWLGWQLYWKAEPWGPFRDNLHAAIIAREVRRPQLRKGVTPKIEDFLYRDPEERQADARARLVGMLRMIGTKRSAKQPRRKRRPKGRGSSAWPHKT